MVGDPVSVPPIDAFLEELHGFSTRRDVENHEEYERKADHNGNADADLVEKLVVGLGVSHLDVQWVLLCDHVWVEPDMPPSLHVFV